MSIDASISPSFREKFLSKDSPFWNGDATCQGELRSEILAKKAPTISYTWNSERPIFTFLKQAASILLFPWGIYRLIHGLVGKIVVPASLGLVRPSSDFEEGRVQIVSPRMKDWGVKRIAIAVDGYTIDAFIVVKKERGDTRRWMIVSHGNGEICEDRCTQSEKLDLLDRVQGSGIFFNYPGVGASSSLPNREAMAKAYRAMLHFLEDKKKGIGAEEIIGYGHSIGGGVQGEALRSHELQKGKKYTFIKSRTFSTLSLEASKKFSRPLGFFVWLFGWNMDSVQSSKKLTCKEIILQTANTTETEEVQQLRKERKQAFLALQVCKGPSDYFAAAQKRYDVAAQAYIKAFNSQPLPMLEDSSKISDDGIIPTEASLAKALLEESSCPKDKKLFLGISERHNEDLGEGTLARLAEECLA